MKPARYVVRGGEQVHAHPYFADRCRVHAFAADAEGEALGKVCDRDFAEPSRGRIRLEPLANKVLVVLARFDAIGSTDPVDGPKGVVEETDVAFWIPVAQVGRWSGRTVRRLGWYMPWIFVDQTWAVIAGRESFGLPKQVADIAIEEDDAGLASLRVATEVLHRYDPKSLAQRRHLLTLRREHESPSAPRDLATFGRGMLGRRWPAGRHGQRLWPGPQLLGTLGSALMGRSSLFGLKQFRDLRRPDRACYQAVVETTCRVRRMHSHRPVAQRYRLTIADHDSHRIVPELGLHARRIDGGHELELDGGWFAAFDFDFEGGRELWRA